MNKAEKIKRVLTNGKKLDYVSVSKVANDLGYSIVFYNTDYGDKELERYGLTERKTEKGFTYAKAARIIFINGDMSPDDRLYVLLHEIGHIALGHIGDGMLMTRNQTLIEIEANNFAYSVLKPKIKQETARKVLRATNGAVEFVSIEKYIKQFGYTVVLYNTSVGDEVLQRYGLKEKAERCKAFTYTGTGRIVFIDNNVSAEDKTHLLCHEVGHILSGHMDCERLCTNNSIYLDFEADSVAYALLNPKKDIKKALTIGAVATVALGVGVVVLLKSRKQQ